MKIITDKTNPILIAETPSPASQWNGRTVTVLKMTALAASVLLLGIGAVGLACFFPVAAIPAILVAHKIAIMAIGLGGSLVLEGGLLYSIEQGKQHLSSIESQIGSDAALPAATSSDSNTPNHLTPSSSTEVSGPATPSHNVRSLYEDDAGASIAQALKAERLKKLQDQLKAVNGTIEQIQNQLSEDEVEKENKNSTIKKKQEELQDRIRHGYDVNTNKEEGQLLDSIVKSGDTVEATFIICDDPRCVIPSNNPETILNCIQNYSSLDALKENLRKMKTELPSIREDLEKTVKETKQNKNDKDSITYAINLRSRGQELKDELMSLATQGGTAIDKTQRIVSELEQITKSLKTTDGQNLEQLLRDYEEKERILQLKLEEKRGQIQTIQNTRIAKRVFPLQAEVNDLKKTKADLESRIEKQKTEIDRLKRQKECIYLEIEEVSTENG